MTSEMRIRRLGWAGLEVEAEDVTLVVDLFENVGSLEPFVGEAHEPLPGPSRSATVALVTHLHSDHADPPAIAGALADDGLVLGPPAGSGEGLETIGMAAARSGFEELGLDMREMEPWETTEVGPFRITAVPAVDGFGDPQVSWVIDAGGRRILHGGDTVFHGSWWLIAMRYGPFDAVFLPVNGAVCDLPHRQPPSPLPAAMDPAQAATATHLLGASAAVPIHYGALHRPPVYAQVDAPAETFVAAAAAAGVRTAVLEPGAALEFDR